MNRKLISVIVACATMLSTITMGFASTDQASNAEENTINGTSAVETAGINENKTDAIKFAGTDKVRANKSSEIVVKFNVNVDPDTLLPNNFSVQEAYGKREAIAVSDVRLAKKGDIDTQGAVITSKSAAKQYAVITLGGSTKFATLYRIKFSNLKSRYGVGQSTAAEDCSTIFVGTENMGVPVTLKSNKINAISNTTFTISFSQNMEQASTENISNYTLKEADGTKAPLAITSVQLFNNKIMFTTASMKPVDYKLTINNVKDVYGNPINTKHSANKVIVHGVTADEAARIITKIESVSTTAPEGSTAVVDPNTQIVVDFDGMVGANATDVTLYTIKQRYGNTDIPVNPSRVDRVDGAGNEDKVILTFGRLEHIAYNLTVKNLLNVDGFSVELEGISFVFAGKGSTLPRIEAVLATDSRTLNIYFDFPVDSPDIKGATKIWTDAGINPGALRFKYYSEPDTAYQDLPAHKVWKSIDNPNVLIIRTNTDAFRSSTEKGYVFVLNVNNVPIQFASNNAEVAGPQITAAIANDNKTVTIYFDQAVKINGTSDEVFTIGTKELVSDAGNSEIPVTTASAVKIDDKTYRITTDANMSNYTYYLRVADLSKITDVSGYYSLKPIDGKNYVSVMFGGSCSASIADVSVMMVDNKTIKVYYPERMNKYDVTNPANYMIYQTSDGATAAAAGINALTAVVYDADTYTATLYLSGTSISGAANNVYYLGIKDTVANETGLNTIKKDKVLNSLGSGILIAFMHNACSDAKPSIKSVNVNLNDNKKITVEFDEPVSTAPVATMLSSGMATADNQIAINDAEWGTASPSAIDLFAITDTTTGLAVSIVSVRKVSNTKFEIVTATPINGNHSYQLTIGDTKTIYNLAGTQVETDIDKLQKYVFTSSK